MGSGMDVQYTETIRDSIVPVGGVGHRTRSVFPGGRSGVFVRDDFMG